MTTQEQYAASFTRLKANDIQRGAVEKYLEEHREINRDYAYDIGLPACGRIQEPGRAYPRAACRRLGHQNGRAEWGVLVYFSGQADTYHKIFSALGTSGPSTALSQRNR